MIYFVVALVAVLMLGGAICTCLRIGETDGIVKYDSTDN